MASLERLTALAGNWRATYQLRGDPSFETDSPTEATITPMLDGRFARIDYTWVESDNRQEGSLVIGYEPEPQLATVAWMDTWHNSDRIMVSTGARTEDGGVDVRGSYPPGMGADDWAWRTVIAPRADGWTMTMFNITPDGEESLAVNAAYERA